jgi:DNA adenine methylase
MYYGGKEKLGAEIAEIVASHADVIKGGPVGYLEPFVGIAGVYRHMPGLLGDYNEWNEPIDYLAGDVNQAVITMWRAVQEGWVPPTHITEKKYNALRNSRDITPEHGFYGHACSFMTRYLGTFYDKSLKRLPLYSSRVADAGKKMRNVRFYAADYRAFSNVRDYIIYCDPPYQKTQNHYSDGYNHVKFDHDRFWKWCDDMARYNVVIVSERSSPPNKRDYTHINLSKNEELFIHS